MMHSVLQGNSHPVGVFLTILISYNMKQNFLFQLWSLVMLNMLEYMDVFEPKRVNSILNISRVNSLKLGGLHVVRKRKKINPTEKNNYNTIIWRLRI